MSPFEAPFCLLHVPSEMTYRPSCLDKPDLLQTEGTSWDGAASQLSLSTSLPVSSKFNARTRQPSGYLPREDSCNITDEDGIAPSPHNLMEGFTVSLSLYMALRSRFKAVLWASLIGCGSQPLGAAMATVWFQAVGDAREDLYGGLVAVTAGVMIGLSFSLFSKALVPIWHSE